VNNEHLVNRVPEAVHRLMCEILSDGVIAGISGAQSYETRRTLTLHQSDSTIKAELTITLDLKVSAAP
jgi:hypothetical protein